MTNFIPGQIVHEFTTRDGRHAILRLPKWEDIVDMLEFINEVSKEDTYITFSGEQITLNDEAEYWNFIFKGMELKNVYKLICEVDGRIVATSEISRYMDARDRSKHVGVFGLVVRNGYREQGIGGQIAKKVIEGAKNYIEGLKIVRLDVYEENMPARNLYRKLGFIEAGMIPGAVKYKDGYIGKVIMYLNLG